MKRWAAPPRSPMLPAARVVCRKDTYSDGDVIYRMYWLRDKDAVYGFELRLTNEEMKQRSYAASVIRNARAYYRNQS